MICPSCQSTEVRRQHTAEVAFACGACGVRFVITNPSSIVVTRPQARKCIWCYGAIDKDKSDLQNPVWLCSKYCKRAYLNQKKTNLQ